MPLFIWIIGKTMKEEEINFDCTGCLECGACRIICRNKGILKWQYPHGTFGIIFRYG